MTEREWKETQKMWNKLEELGDVTFGIFYDPKNPTTPYEQIKEQYFVEYLDEKETENITFNLENNILEKLYKEADDLNITIDELIIELLKVELDKNQEEEELIEYGPAKCCYHCEDGVGGDDYSKSMICEMTGKRVHRTFVCCDYMQK